jgi:hypothetical protein
VDKNTIETNMIKSPFPYDTTIKDSILTRENLRLADFGYNPSRALETYRQAIDDGIQYLRMRGYGTLEIPPIQGVSTYVSYIDILKSGTSITDRYRSFNYRYPVSNEERAITGDFKVGDIIYNTNIIANKARGWICVEAGRPGVWEAYDFFKNWFTEIEKVDVLPEPGPRQLGRQVFLTSGGSNIYVCKLVNDVYSWYTMD